MTFAQVNPGQRFTAPHGLYVRLTQPQARIGEHEVNAAGIDTLDGRDNGRLVNFAPATLVNQPSA